VIQAIATVCGAYGIPFLGKHFSTQIFDNLF
jgi:hypothetical protein